MSADANALFIPGHATVFHAAPNTAMPATALAAFSLTGLEPTGWTNIGHTSKENTVSFAKEGGEKTSLDTYLADGVRTIYSSESWGLTVPALQFDKDVLDLAFNGGFDDDDGYIIPGSNTGSNRALFLLFTDGTGKLGFYIPNNSVKLGDAIGVDPTQFLELPLSASIQSASETAIPAVNGVPGIMKLYKTGLAAA